MSGFYFAHRLTDEIGLSFAVVYIPEEAEDAKIRELPKRGPLYGTKSDAIFVDEFFGEE